MALIPAVCAANCGTAIAALGGVVGMVPLAAVGTLGAAGYAAYRLTKGSEEEEDSKSAEDKEWEEQKPKDNPTVQLYAGKDPVPVTMDCQPTSTGDGANSKKSNIGSSFF